MHPKMQTRGVVETCLYVDDLAAAEAFYCDVLGCEKRSSHPDRHLFLQCGGQMLLLFIAATTEELHGELPPHGAHGQQHVALAIASADYDAWKAHLHNHDVAIEHEQAWGDRGKSMYFRDPAGNSVELAPPVIWGLPAATPWRDPSTDS